MNCDSIPNGLTFNVTSSGKGGPITVDKSSVVCNSINGSPDPVVTNVAPSALQWNGTLTNVPDGIIEILVNNPVSDGGIPTGVRQAVGYIYKALLTLYTFRLPIMYFSARGLRKIQ